MHKVTSNEELRIIIANKRGYLKNGNIWHNLANLNPEQGECGTGEMRISKNYPKYYTENEKDALNSEKCDNCW